MKHYFFIMSMSGDQYNQYFSPKPTTFGAAKNSARLAAYNESKANDTWDSGLKEYPFHVTLTIASITYLALGEYAHLLNNPLVAPR